MREHTFSYAFQLGNDPRSFAVCFLSLCHRSLPPPRLGRFINTRRCKFMLIFRSRLMNHSEFRRESLTIAEKFLTGRWFYCEHIHIVHICTYAICMYWMHRQIYNWLSLNEQNTFTIIFIMQKSNFDSLEIISWFIPTLFLSQLLICQYVIHLLCHFYTISIRLHLFFTDNVRRHIRSAFNKFLLKKPRRVMISMRATNEK